MVRTSRSAAIANEIGMEREKKAVPATANTNKISSVAYAVEESASEAKTASPTSLPTVCWGISLVARGEPSKIRRKVIREEGFSGGTGRVPVVTSASSPFCGTLQPALLAPHAGGNMRQWFFARSGCHWVSGYLRRLQPSGQGRRTMRLRVSKPSDHPDAWIPQA